MAMTPSPMRTMAAKCLARAGLVINIGSWSAWARGPLPEGLGRAA
jgi:hypothetical protein